MRSVPDPRNIRTRDVLKHFISEYTDVFIAQASCSYDVLTMDKFLRRNIPGHGQVQGDDAPAVAPVRRGRGRPQGGRGHGNVAAAEMMILEILEKAMSSQTLMMFMMKVMRNTIYQCNSVEIIW